MMSKEIEKVSVYVFEYGAVLLAANDSEGQSIKINSKNSSRGVTKYILEGFFPLNIKFLLRQKP
jgi:hypothetical protein